MTLSFPAVVAAGLAFGAFFVAKGKPPETALASVLVPAAKADVRTQSNRYLLRSVDNLSCKVIRGGTEGAYTLRADPDCERLLPGLSKVRFWRERDDGAIVFSREGADDLVAFGAADGVAYESFRPVSALISLAADD
jgi:hypothetical protein